MNKSELEKLIREQVARAIQEEQGRFPYTEISNTLARISVEVDDHFETEEQKKALRSLIGMVRACAGQINILQNK